LRITEFVTKTELNDRGRQHRRQKKDQAEDWWGKVLKNGETRGRSGKACCKWP